VSTMGKSMKEWEKAWDKVDLFDKWKPKSSRDHWHEKAFKAGWDAAIDQVLRRCWTRKTDWDNYGNVKRDLTQLLDVDPDNPQS